MTTEKSRLQKIEVTFTEAEPYKLKKGQTFYSFSSANAQLMGTAPKAGEGHCCKTFLTIYWENGLSWSNAKIEMTYQMAIQGMTVQKHLQDTWSFVVGDWTPSHMDESNAKAMRNWYDPESVEGCRNLLDSVCLDDGPIADIADRFILAITDDLNIKMIATQERDDTTKIHAYYDVDSMLSIPIEINAPIDTYLWLNLDFGRKWKRSRINGWTNYTHPDYVTV